MEYEFEDEPKGDRRNPMSQESSRISTLVDTTDCLEAISTIRCWKNFLFIIIFLGLLLLQLSVVLVSFKWVRTDEPPAANVSVLPADVNQSPAAKQEFGPAPATKEKIKQTAKQVAHDTNVIGPPQPGQTPSVAEPNQPNQPQPVTISFTFEPKVKHITALVRLVNFVLIPASILYCLAMLFSFKVSLIGRLGGINHITRAFFLSLLFMILLLPWQILFAPVFAGAMFTPAELINACMIEKSTPAIVCFYLRFSGYWLIVLLILIFAQVRSMRWAKATLKRLEVV